MRSEKWETMSIAVALIAITVIIGLLATSPPPTSSKMPRHSSAVQVLSQHHHPQPTGADDEPLSAEVGDSLEVILAPQERITRPVTELRMYCSTDTPYWHALADTKPVTIPLNNAGYCRVVLIESLMAVPPGNGQFDGDMLKLRQLPPRFNCHFNPLFTRILVAP